MCVFNLWEMKKDILWTNNFINYTSELGITKKQRGL